MRPQNKILSKKRRYKPYHSRTTEYRKKKRSTARNEVGIKIEKLMSARWRQPQSRWGCARFGVGRWLPKLHDSGRGGDIGTCTRAASTIVGLMIAAVVIGAKKRW